jgi:hypothetical protein
MDSDGNVVSIADRSVCRGPEQGCDPAIVEPDDRGREPRARTPGQAGSARVEDPATPGRILPFKRPGRGTGDGDRADVPTPPSGPAA